MGANSQFRRRGYGVREYIGFDARVNTIRMLVSHPSYKGKVIATVEGDTDVRMFRSLLHPDNVKIEPVNGKIELYRIISKLIEEGIDNIFGICDADFDNFLNNKMEYIETYIFPTDLHDIETMMFQSPSLEKFIYEFTNSVNMDEIKKVLRESVLTAAYSIGLVRLINYKHNLILNFKGLNFRLFADIQKVDITINLSKLLDHLLQRSSNKSSIATKEFIMQKYNEFFELSPDPLQICSGHDITSLIAQVYSQRWASIDTNLNQSKVESSLRLGYTSDFFSKTELYNLLENWAASKNANVLA